ncbi:2-succinyl-6-hydroxy-2,4-cyclohexadiene-1-carboxylate synthase [Shewanella cyperi]|uniref:Putative 2-succinyl-6-hydroxy-2,4-cyclohexadiene-1-carboxylate synthase n=1 Tax=Shewanella cyperi TaxID=2814292 RepID=A0A974XK93_9GAMM|nr:2-succinyl-6-hydroxy-2,4-cyclohexadiene-1-carboxylate synthase [Shewanella cyperi]
MGEATVSKPLLVLLHGFLGDRHDWRSLLPLLEPHFHCLCPELPGHGLNVDQPLPTPGLEAAANHILAQLDSITPHGAQPGRFHLYGYSLGGRIALHLAKQLALSAPERLLSLTLESSHPGLASASERQERLASDAVWAERLRHEPMTEFLDAWYRQPPFAELSEQPRLALIEKRAGQNPAALANCLLACSLGLQQDLSALPGQLPCPVHYLYGERDSKFAALAQVWWAQAEQQPGINKLHLHPIAAAGHNCHLARPEAVTAVLIQQLQQVHLQKGL